MITYMHWHSSYVTDIPTCTLPFVVVAPTYSSSVTYPTRAHPSHRHHEQGSTVTTRRRRRLDDPIVSYAANYYATYPRQTPQSHSNVPKGTSSPRNYRQAKRADIYCDLFNLLDLSEPSGGFVKPEQRKYCTTDHNCRRHHRPMDVEDVHPRMKSMHDRKRAHTRPFARTDGKRQEDRSPFDEQFDRTVDPNRQVNDNYQRRSTPRRFFRRLVRQYFCVPPAFANNGYSS
jgi:hypothetical protein